ncbi:protein FAR1-RELATED SEQUENCE 5-like [Chenopodium quinoa]|uniref:protein FAR1-RELATED SEQUENCE 5-like n=1 Tax=Chenopodium quinoa TaxID=63459 RepID=UPI000B793E62|nr:protein FAR1-RELATED SEQUENCE 5-like [Chenopodium quinoa]
MTEELQNFPESQESMEIEEIGDSLLNLEIEEIQDDARYAEQHEIDYTGSLVGFTAATLEEIFEEYKKHAFKKKRQVSITRTGCKAFIRAKKNKEGMFEVEEHVMQHNHELKRREWQHLQRSERKITEDKTKVIDIMAESGLRPAESYRLMAYEACGENVLAHTMKDHFNYITRKKMMEIEGGDAQTVIDILNQRQSEEPYFFFRFKIGEKTNRLTTIFWRDSEMKEVFDIYGDVTIFDTTYRTNKYNLICAPIVGVNSRWQNVMFGCAFIPDEKIETFEWVLSTFKKSVGGSEPASIFTDQDLAMSIAIQKEEQDAASQEAESMQQNNTTATTETEEQIPTVMDPERANTKGRSKRIKGHFEKGKQGNKKKNKSNDNKGRYKRIWNNHSNTKSKVILSSL